MLAESVTTTKKPNGNASRSCRMTLFLCESKGWDYCEVIAAPILVPVGGVGRK